MLHLEARRHAQELGFEVWVDRRIVLRHWKECEQRSISGALDAAHFEGYCRGIGKDPNDPEESRQARDLWRATMGGEAKKRDAEMRESVKQKRASMRLLKENAT